MKIQVRVDNQFYDVEVGDLNERPIIATIEDQTFEVWPETSPAEQEQANFQERSTSNSSSTSTEASVPTQIYAPIPGVVVMLSVETGTQVTRGDELCVLEAMKMKNAIRAPHAGKVTVIHVAVGQHDQHHDLLIELTSDR
jgi:biotin carboxyl carrier protein